MCNHTVVLSSVYICAIISQTIEKSWIEVRRLCSRPRRWGRDPTKRKALTLVCRWRAISRQLWGASKHFTWEGGDILRAPKKYREVCHSPVRVVTKGIVS